MDLSNLKPAEGATTSRKRIGRGTGSGKGGTSPKDIKDKNQDRVIRRKSVLKEDRCRCSVVFPNSVSNH